MDGVWRASRQTCRSNIINRRNQIIITIKKDKIKHCKSQIHTSTTLPKYLPDIYCTVIPNKLTSFNPWLNYKPCSWHLKVLCTTFVIMGLWIMKTTVAKLNSNPTNSDGYCIWLQYYSRLVAVGGPEGPSPQMLNLLLTSADIAPICWACWGLMVEWSPKDDFGDDFACWWPLSRNDVWKLTIQLWLMLVSSN